MHQLAAIINLQISKVGMEAANQCLGNNLNSSYHRRSKHMLNTEDTINHILNTMHTPLHNLLGK